MAKRKKILIGCPQYRRLVSGTYACDEAGRYRLLPDGTFDVAGMQCDQLGGRCMQTLCVLHRFNRRGPDSWYPSEVLAAPDARRPRRGTARGPGRGRRRRDGDLDVLA
jgi:hypothetical protein